MSDMHCTGTEMLFVPQAVVHMVTISIMALFYYSMRFS